MLLSRAKRKMNDKASSAENAAERGAIRIFLSSTFIDLDEERNAINRDVMPYINGLLKSKGIDAACVDLRWGITSEEGDEGLITSLCFDEIDRCRPFFLGIVGDRYGWIPQSWNERELERFDWIEPGKNLSITELEMMYGAFMYDKRNIRAVFLIKKNNNTAKSELRARKRLVERIKKSGYPYAEYSDIDSFTEKARQLIGNMTADITAADNSDGKYGGFVRRTRRLAESFVGREDIIGKLDRFSKGSGRYCLLTGESGSGKSVLLAKWASEAPSDRLIYYADAAEAPTWQDAVIYMINSAAGRRLVLNSDDDSFLRRSFRTEMGKRAAEAPVVLIFDSVDMLRDGNSGFGWLPDELPENVHIVLSTSSGEAAEKLKSLIPVEINVGGLSPEQKADITKRYLLSYGKKLDKDQTNSLIKCAGTNNPRFLTTVLEELRLTGSYFALKENIAKYASCGGNKELFESVAERLSRDYPSSDAILPYLVCSDQAVLESEILRLCGVPQISWSALRQVIEPYTSGEKGVKLISDELRGALLAKYSSDGDKWKKTVDRYIDFYSGRSADRKAKMLPDVLASAGRFGELLELLSEPEVLAELYKLSPPRCSELIIRAQNETGLSLEDMLKGAIERCDPNALAYAAVCLLSLGHAKKAEEMLNDVLAESRLKGNSYNVQFALGYLSRIKQRQGDLYNTERLLEEKKKLCSALGMELEEARTVGNIGLVCLMAGKLDEAERAIAETKEKYSFLGYNDGQQIAEGHLGNIALRRGNTGDAKEHYSEQMRLSTLCSNPYGKSAALGGLGQVAVAVGDLDEAERLFTEQVGLCEELGDNDGMQTAIGNIAVTAMKRNDWDKAETLLRKKNRICKDADNIAGLSVGMTNLARCLTEAGRTEEAEKICIELVELLKSRRSYIERLPGAYCVLAGIQASLGKKNEALTSAMNAKAVAGQLGQSDQVDAADSLIRELRA